jgi:glycosyltransferase involved in cell wall biosynthesis
VPHAVTVSFRLGGDDGVSVEAQKWATALHSLGFDARRVAGAIEDAGAPDDVVMPGLALGTSEPIDTHALRAAIDADLVIVDNICSLPINLDAARAVAAAVAHHRGRVLFRHHDLTWQRRQFQHLESEFPPRIDGALHATINLRSRRELEARKYSGAATIHNYFDLDPQPGDREGTRDAFGFATDDLVVFQPARAIERKNVPGGVRFAQRLVALLPDGPVQYWLSGPAEDGYEETLARIVERAQVPVTLGRATRAADAYAAADVVVFPSTWEGFGNPIIESIAARRPCAAAPYPVLAEILASGVRTFSASRPEQVARFLVEQPDVRDHYFDVNVQRAALSYSIADLPAALDEAFANHGWLAW